MSRYLIDEIHRTPSIQVRTHTQVTSLLGQDQLEAVQLSNSATNRVSRFSARGLFVFIGASPCTEWLGGQLAQDSHRFLLTGRDIPPEALGTADWTPLFLETSRRGIFCAGDARSGSVKRVATAIGEGSMAVRLAFERFEASEIVPGTVAIADTAKVSR